MEDMKYYFYEYIWVDGEHEYYSSAVISCHESEDVEKLINEKILARMWGDAIKKEGDYYYSPDMDIAVSLRGMKEVSKTEFNVLKQFLIYYTFMPEPEKIIFT